MKRKLIHILMPFVLLIAGRLSAQQDPMYSMYMFDKMLINPAYTGSSNWVVGTLKYRAQFVGLEGAPVTQTFNFHAPLQTKHMGLGLKVVHDKIAVAQTINATGFYSYHLGIGGGKFSFGIEGGIYNQVIDFSNLVRHDQNDNSLPYTRESKLVPDASFGIYYQKKNFYMGGAVAHLIKTKMSFTNYDHEPSAHLYKHYFIIAGAVADLSDNFAIEPSVLMKNVQAAPVQFDLNCNLVFRERFAIGASYRTGDAVAGLVKINITDELRIGYSYDYTLSRLANYSNGSHEVLVSYGIKLLPPPAEKEIHPRYYF